ncbi:MAG: membrane lipoprotein lipid attachment site-containing protein [Alphaproteobacteria bacterium]|nr:membrane lipoprotein lipid attachment site-containing protein [Alphaproteobacteria bacterium]
MKKIIFLFVFLLFVYGCSHKTINVEGVNGNSAYIANYNLSKEDILKNYDGGRLQIYEKEEIQNIVSAIESDSKDIYTLQKVDVLNVVGSPYLIKNEVVIELWQYRNPFCILNVIWDNSKSAIKDIVAYDNNLKKIDAKKCLLATVNLNPDNKKESV